MVWTVFQLKPEGMRKMSSGTLSLFTFSQPPPSRGGVACPAVKRGQSRCSDQEGASVHDEGGVAWSSAFLVRAARMSTLDRSVHDEGGAKNAVFVGILVSSSKTVRTIDQGALGFLGPGLPPRRHPSLFHRTCPDRRWSGVQVSPSPGWCRVVRSSGRPITALLHGLGLRQRPEVQLGLLHFGCDVLAGLRPLHRLLGHEAAFPTPICPQPA